MRSSFGPVSCYQVPQLSDVQAYVGGQPLDAALGVAKLCEGKSTPFA